MPQSPATAARGRPSRRRAARISAPVGSVGTPVKTPPRSGQRSRALRGLAAPQGVSHRDPGHVLSGVWGQRWSSCSGTSTTLHRVGRFRLAGRRDLRWHILPTPDEAAAALLAPYTGWFAVPHPLLLAAHGPAAPDPTGPAAEDAVGVASSPMSRRELLHVHGSTQTRGLGDCAAGELCPLDTDRLQRQEA